nr:hypothetical protein [Tanacetum cinerariifolium]
MGRLQDEFVSLLGEIRDMEIDDDSDSFICSLSHDGDFSVSNARKYIDDYMLPNLLPCTRLVRAWSDSKIPILSFCEDVDSWLLSWRASKDSKDHAYVIFATTC